MLNSVKFKKPNQLPEKVYFVVHLFVIKWIRISAFNKYFLCTEHVSNVPTANLAIYKEGVYYWGIKIYNCLPTAIKDLSGDKNKFKLVLKRYLLHNSFYSLEEYFNI